MKEHLDDILLECTTQDLLRYDDYNNDGHLTLQELYTAFRESHPSPFHTQRPLSKLSSLTMWQIGVFNEPGTIKSLSEALSPFVAKRAPDPLGQ